MDQSAVAGKLSNQPWCLAYAEALRKVGRIHRVIYEIDEKAGRIIAVAVQRKDRSA